MVLNKNTTSPQTIQIILMHHSHRQLTTDISKLSPAKAPDAILPLVFMPLALSTLATASGAGLRLLFAIMVSWSPYIESPRIFPGLYLLYPSLYLLVLYPLITRELLCVSRLVTISHVFLWLNLCPRASGQLLITALWHLAQTDCL